MAKYEQGTEVGIRCEVQPGPFSGEKLISFETVEGPISGFVREGDLKQVGPKEWVIRAVVEEDLGATLHVRVRGSFFTTNGLATISQEMALAA